MSERDLDINLTKSTNKKIPSASEVEEFRARIIQIRERGLVIDALAVDLPDDLHGEWVHNDAVSINQKEILGFGIDTEYSVKKAITDGGDGTGRVGDVIYMTQPKWKHDMLEGERRTSYFKNHLQDKRKQKEEKDFLDIQRNLDMPTTTHSTANEATGPQISEALNNKKD